jgi:hypothetical protein
MVKRTLNPEQPGPDKKKSPSPEDSGAVYEFRIAIEGSSPRIWRKLRVPGDFTLYDLHMALQICFGWTESHLHSFTINGTEYKSTDLPVGSFLSMDDESADELDYTLDALNLKEKEHFTYLYDFGDSWEHKLRVSKITLAAGDERRPRCLGGKRSGPLEDSGGIWGYENMLDILKNPEHEEYEEISEWAGDHDSEYFNLEEINRLLDKTFRPPPKASKPASSRKPAHR